MEIYPPCNFFLARSLLPIIAILALNFTCLGFLWEFFLHWWHCGLYTLLFRSTFKLISVMIVFALCNRKCMHGLLLPYFYINWYKWCCQTPYREQTNSLTSVMAVYCRIIWPSCWYLVLFSPLHHWWCQKPYGDQINCNYSDGSVWRERVAGSPCLDNLFPPGTIKVSPISWNHEFSVYSNIILINFLL